MDSNSKGINYEIEQYTYTKVYVKNMAIVIPKTGIQII